MQEKCAEGMGIVKCHRMCGDDLCPGLVDLRVQAMESPVSLLLLRSLRELFSDSGYNQLCRLLCAVVS